MTTQVDYTTMSMEELQAAFQAAAEQAHEGIRVQCHILAEMHSRGVTHPAFRHSLYRHWEAITSGELTVPALLRVHEYPRLIQALRQLPHERQLDLANGGRIEIMDYNSEGEIVEGIRTLDSLSNPAVVSRVFDGDRLRTKEEQKALLEEQGPPTPREHTNTVPRPVSADMEAGVLKVGNRTVTPDELVGPLGELGWGLLRLPQDVAAE